MGGGEGVRRGEREGERGREREREGERGREREREREYNVLSLHFEKVC